MASIAAIVLSIAALAVLLGGIASMAGQVAFITRSYRVQGIVTSEWCYRMYGRAMRYYRVEFHLSNGQRAELRSSVASSRFRPKVGELVPVLISERAGQSYKAKIGTFSELWFSSALLLFIGVGGAMFTAFVASAVFACAINTVPPNLSVKWTSCGKPQVAPYVKR